MIPYAETDAGVELGVAGQPFLQARQTVLKVLVKPTLYRAEGDAPFSSDPSQRYAILKVQPLAFPDLTLTVSEILG